MPLQLGDASTERRQLLVFDPTVREEVLDTLRRYHLLRRQGFRLRDRTESSIALDPPLLDARFGFFRVLSPNGDDRVIWDRTVAAQVREAFQKFTDFIKRGYSAYATFSDGKKGARIDAFDPSLEEIVMVPATVPG